MNNQPRVFRGRAGANDRRLPKHNARRRNQHHEPSSTKGSDKYDNDNKADAEPKRPTTRTTYEGRTNNDDDDNSVQQLLQDGEDEDENEDVILMNDSESVPQEPKLAAEQPEDTATATAATTISIIKSTKKAEPWKAELRHLNKRIRNVQESIQLGTEGIMNPGTYQDNVLFAVENCVNEWRSILNHYHYKTTDSVITTAIVVEEEEEVAPMDPDSMKETALAVYMLLQFSVQCGPLTGGKPGYFKRCGGTVAKLVVQYLVRNVPDDATCGHLFLSSKQTDAIAAWRVNASKAALEDKAPSKSALKLQQGISKKTKKNKK